MVSVSVPGKVILMGEHAVVYGKPALVTAIDRRMTISIEGIEKRTRVSSEKDNGKDSYIHHILQTCEEAWDISIDGTVRFHISSSIPSGYHLGSSGSLAMGIVGAICVYEKIPFDKDRMISIAQKAENFIHSVSSGIDPAIAFSGGLLWYQKNADGTRIMRTLSPEKFRSINRFFLLDTGKPKESTGEMVARVSGMYKGNSAEMKTYMDENERQTKRLLEAVETGDEKHFIDAMKKGEETLEAMDVVPDLVKPCIREIEKSGGASKITGGGGKAKGAGFMLCYHSDRKTVEAIARKFRFTLSPVVLGGEGLKIEKR